MHISIIFYPEERDYTEQFQNKTVIVFDIFRATTTITTAMAYGAKSIIPVRTLEEARTYQGTNVLIAGEDNGIKPADFDLGNSPSEFRHVTIRGRTIVFRTRNGTQTIVLSQSARHLLIGALVNASACVRKAASLQRDIVLFCSGTRGNFSIEDSLAAGYFASLLATHHGASLDDSALLLTNSLPVLEANDYQLPKQGKSAQRLQDIDLWQDVNDCLQLDRYHIVPYVRDGWIIID